MKLAISEFLHDLKEFFPLVLLFCDHVDLYVLLQEIYHPVIFRLYPIYYLLYVVLKSELQLVLFLVVVLLQSVQQVVLH